MGKIIKKFSDEDWEKILAGKNVFSIPLNIRFCYPYKDKYYEFIHNLIEKAESGKDISKVVYLEEMMKDIISYFTVSEKFLEKYKDFLDWRQVAQHQKLSEKFIEKYKDKWQWYEICSNQTLSEDFIRKHFDDFDETCFAEIAGHKENNLTESFIREFSSLLQMGFVGECQRVDKNLLREFADKICFGNWYHNDRKHEVMTQEETCEFMCGYYDKNQMGLTIAEVAQGLNYDYSPY